MPAPPHSLHQPALHGERPANVVCGCCFAARPANCWQLLCFKACAGRIVRRLCSPAAALFCRLCVPARLCHAMPTALHISCPRSFCFAPTYPCPCAPGSSSEVVKTVLLAATTRACRGSPCTGSFLTLTLFTFFLQSP